MSYVGLGAYTPGTLIHDHTVTPARTYYVQADGKTLTPISDAIAPTLWRFPDGISLADKAGFIAYLQGMPAVCKTDGQFVYGENCASFFTAYQNQVQRAATAAAQQAAAQRANATQGTPVTPTPAPTPAPTTAPTTTTAPVVASPGLLSSFLSGGLTTWAVFGAAGMGIYFYFKKKRKPVS